MVIISGCRRSADSGLLGCQAKSQLHPLFTQEKQGNVAVFSVRFTDAIYKQWIPNTNFENASNWNGQRVPCSQDKVVFENNKKVSVYVQSRHSLTDMYLPWDGELILAPGAGFSASSGDEADCEKGSTTTFNDADRYQWFDPTLWNSALSIDDLESGKSLFSVDSERVPCSYDDVIFSPETSFRVNIKATESEIYLKSIAVLGRRFTRNEEFSLYLQSNTGKLQFPSPDRLHVTDTKCVDRTGCECGNAQVLQEICSVLLEHSGNTCPDVECANPLQPIGHCCRICGAIISLEYTPDFDLDNYRSRLVHTFLSLAKYSGVKLAVSKVQKPQTFLGIIPRDSVQEIQIVILDDKNGTQTGSDAQQLAYDIISDIENHGKSFGIIKGKVLTATGSNTGAHQGQMAAGSISGIIIGVILCVSLLGVTYFLYIADAIRFPSLGAVMFWRKMYEQETESETGNKGFDNPIFETTVENPPGAQGLYTGEEALKGITLTQSGVHFANPLYDDSQCDV
ncbi:protein amnionless [Rhinophrynus dorsalis]